MKTVFDIKGMTCAACVGHVEKAAKKVEGVTDVRVSLMENQMIVEGDYDINAICSSVNKAGYTALPRGEKPKENHLQALDAEEKRKKRGLIVSVVLLVLLMFVAMGEMLGLPVPALLRGNENIMIKILLEILLMLPILMINRGYYARGFKALLHLSPNMDSLVAVGSGAAILYGMISTFMIAYGLGHGDAELVHHYSMQLYFESGAMIVTLVSVGKWLESRARGQTGQAVEKLKKLIPDSVTVRRDGREITLHLDEVRIGDIVIVRPGQRVPVDGVVITGRCAADESALTGESLPVEKAEGSEVISGSIVTDSPIELRAEKVGDATALSGIIRMVSDAGMTKPRIARMADKIAAVFVPAVMSVALIVFIVWLCLGANIGEALRHAIAVLVISCPCALGLATPVAVTVGLGKGAENGILYRSAEAIEQCGRIRNAVLDKTGTITEGRLSVTAVITENEEELKRIAKALEKNSRHPVAMAVSAYCADAEEAGMTACTELPGLGVQGWLNGEECLCGNEKLMRSRGIALPMAQLTPHLEKGLTPVYTARGGRLLGTLFAADTVRDDSVAAIRALHGMGIRTTMLTGDKATAAGRIATIAGVDEVIAEVMPGDKEQHIRDLQQKDGAVMMIGDGINDAPALTRANVGMAIGAGSDIAIDAADVVLMRSSLTDAVNAVLLSRKVMRNIRENLFWAFCYNVICIPIAAGVLTGIGLDMSPMVGAACMSVSSVCVCLNALRLRRIRFMKGSAAPAETAQAEPKPVPCACEAGDAPLYTLTVDGMMCEHCEASVRGIIEANGGTVREVSHTAGKAVFTLRDENALAAIMDGIREEDYTPGAWTKE